jgi:hypothetical protein
MSWKPNTHRGVLVGAGLILAIALLDAGLLWRVVRGPLNGITFSFAFLVLLSLPVTALIAYRLYDLLYLRYEFDRNRLMIVTAATKQIVPMQSIERIIDGQGTDLQARIKGLVWPGCFIGTGDVCGVGLTLFYGITPARHQAIIVTPSLAYGVSVPDMDAFRDVFLACQGLGQATEVHQESIQADYVRWPIWTDRVAQVVLAGGILLSALLFAILLFRYPHMPNLLPMHYDAAGRVDRIAPRSEAFDLPVIGLIAWATNSVLGAVFYRRERMLSYLAWSGTLVVQVLFLLALWDIAV